VSRQSAATILVGPNTVWREGLARILDAADFRIVASGASLDHLQLDSLVKHQAILLIVDSSDDPGVAVGIIEQFKAHYPTGRVVVLGEHETPTNINSVLRAGAHIYFDKAFIWDAFIKALDMVMLGEPLEVVGFGLPTCG
jgi:two-component system nitrate/nitrite response regulator NarL